MALRCDLADSDLSVDSWAHCLKASPGVLRVAPHIDAHGQSLKSALPLAVLAAGGGHHAAHELKVFVDHSDRFLTAGVSNKTAGKLHVYMREPPKTLQQFAKTVFNAAVAELNRWHRFHAPDSGRVWRWRASDEQWFFEDAPGDWTQYLSPEGKKWWWNCLTEDWFIA